MENEITECQSIESLQEKKDMTDKVSDELKKAVLLESAPLPSFTPVVKGK